MKFSACLALSALAVAHACGFTAVASEARLLSKASTVGHGPTESGSAEHAIMFVAPRPALPSTPGVVGEHTGARHDLDPFSLFSKVGFVSETDADSLIDSAVGRGTYELAYDTPVAVQPEVAPQSRLSGYRVALHVMAFLRSDATVFALNDGSEAVLKSGTNGGYSLRFIPDRLKQTDGTWA